MVASFFSRKKKNSHESVADHAGEAQVNAPSATSPDDTSQPNGARVPWAAISRDETATMTPTTRPSMSPDDDATDRATTHDTATANATELEDSRLIHTAEPSNGAAIPPFSDTAADESCYEDEPSDEEGVSHMSGATGVTENGTAETGTAENGTAENGPDERGTSTASTAATNSTAASTSHAANMPSSSSHVPGGQAAPTEQATPGGQATPAEQATLAKQHAPAEQATPTDQLTPAQQHTPREHTTHSPDLGDLPPAKPMTFAQSVAQWKADLAALTTDRASENLPRYTLSNAHPGGLAQLYAQHPTRLSNLVREPGAYKRAMEAARRIITRQGQLAAQHGLAPTHLAIGYASWLDKGVKCTSPALLRPMTIHEDGNELVLTLGTQLQIAPVLAAAAQARGIVLNAETLLGESGTDVSSFSPTRAFAYVRRLCQSMPDFELRDDLAMGIYDHPAARLLRELDAEEALAASSVVRALAGDEHAALETARPLPEGNPEDRDPWSERGIGDLTPQHHDILEAALAGRSLVIRGQQSANNTLLAALLAECAAKGRTTVHVAGGRSRLARVEGVLSDAGVAQIAARIDGSPEDTQRLQECLRLACDGQIPPSQTDTTVDAMRTELRQTRQALSAYTRQLHAPFRQFGVSAMDALQVLTDITSRKPAPRTKIRLREDVLLSIATDQGEAARAILHRAADLGMFARATAHSAWTGAVINAPEQVDVVVGAVSRLATESVPALRNMVVRMAKDGQLVPAQSMRHWQSQLSMLQGIREALDVFKPEIFERSAADMVIATAPSQWRKERGVVMRRSQRSRLVKHAKDMLVPGRHVADLHRELVLVQEKREVWRRFSSADGWPVLPRGLNEAAAVTAAVKRDLELVAPALATGFPDLSEMPLHELQRLLDRLAADPQGAELLPRRVAVLKEASAAGVDQLLTDLRARHVEGDMIDAELDLAWWASVLGLILASDEAFRGMDPLRLTDLLQRNRELDAAQVATLVPQALENVQRRRQHAIGARAGQYAAVQEFVDHGQGEAVSMYADVALTSLLVPVVLTLPTLVPLLVPAGRQVDVLILDDVSALPVAELVPLIARASQVVVVAHDELSGSVSALAEVLPVADVAPRPSRLNDQVVRLLSYYGMPHVGIPRPWALRSEPLSAVWVEASGMPSPGASAIESTAAEVDAVIDVIIDHVLRRPEDSLAVIALNAVHADRIREAVARAIAQEPSLGAFFDPGRAEPFVVADPSQVGGVRRDHIVMAVGFAKTPHGRVLHDFGVFSRPEGATAMGRVLSCAREDLTIVSAIRPGEIDRERLSSVGAQMLVDVLATAEGQVPIAPGSWPVIEGEPDRLLIDLAERLYAMGLDVIANLGVDGGLRIPLAIGHPAVPERMLLAVLTDDAQYMAEPSLRVRDRLIPHMLYEQGWQVFTAMSLAVFIDPASVAQQIVDVVVDEVQRMTTPPEPLSEPTPVVIAPAELAPEEQAALDATNDARARHDEALTGMIQIITAEDSRDAQGHAGAMGASAASGMGGAGTGKGGAGTGAASGKNSAEATHADLGGSATALPGAGTANGNHTSGAFTEALAQWNAAVGEVSASAAPRAPRPPIARGLPLSAYGDDQLDELAVWVRSDGIKRTHEELVEELRGALRLTRRGTQTDAVLSHVIRRTEPPAAADVAAEGAANPAADEDAVAGMAEAGAGASAERADEAGSAGSAGSVGEARNAGADRSAGGAGSVGEARNAAADRGAGGVGTAGDAESADQR